MYHYDTVLNDLYSLTTLNLSTYVVLIMEIVHEIISKISIKNYS